MKKVLLLAVLGLILGVGQAKASTCVSATVATYVTQGSCSFDGLNFSQFAASFANLTGSSVTVTPIADGNGVGFELTPTTTGSFTTTQANVTLDLDFQFVVACASGTACIDDIFEKLVGSVQAAVPPFGPSGNGADVLKEVYCLNDPSIPPGSCPAGDIQGTQVLTVTPTNSSPTSNPNFSPVSTLSMDKDVSASSNNTTTAAVLALYDQFSLVTTPEPSGFAMLFAGLLGLALFSLRRKSVV